MLAMDFDPSPADDGRESGISTPDLVTDGKESGTSTPDLITDGRESGTSTPLSSVCNDTLDNIDPLLLVSTPAADAPFQAPVHDVMNCERTGYPMTASMTPSPQKFIIAVLDSL